MAFPATGGIKDQLAPTLTEIMSLARAIKNSSTSMSAQSAAGSVSARGIALLGNDLQSQDDRLSSLESAPGLLQYARDQYDDQAFDIAAEFTAFRAAVASTIAWIDTNLPKSAGGRWLEVEEIVSGRVIERTLTPAQTVGLRVELTLLIATID